MGRERIAAIHADKPGVFGDPKQSHNARAGTAKNSDCCTHDLQKNTAEARPFVAARSPTKFLIPNENSITMHILGNQAPKTANKKMQAKNRRRFPGKWPKPPAARGSTTK
jgi:hypothetical protein